jgi:hypothetical protein
MNQRQQQPEPILLLKRSDFRKITDYVLAVPTGTLPGSRLADVLNTLDSLTVVPAQAVPMLEMALRQITQPQAPPTGSSPVPPKAPLPVPTEKKSNGADITPVE